MLGKLLKYEVKATARLFLPLYLTILIFATINRFFLAVPNAKENSFSFYHLGVASSMFVYGILMVGLVVMTLLVLIQRFHKNLLGDEGYLMFTLPVHSRSHILSKLIISMIWTILSSIVAFCSILVISSNNIYLPELFGKMITTFGRFHQEFGAASYLISFEVIVLGLLILASTILTIYAAIALGHLFNKHKLLASFGMYIVLKIISQTIMSLTGAVFFNQSIFRPDTTLIPSAMLINGILLGTILYYGIFTAGYFYLTNYILKKKLNLE